MNAFIEGITALHAWGITHPGAVTAILTVWSAIAAYLIGLRMGRRDVRNRMYEFVKRAGHSGYTEEGHITGKDPDYTVKFHDMSLTPYVVVHHAGEKVSRHTPVTLKWIVPDVWKHTEWPHWDEPAAHTVPFWNVEVFPYGADPARERHYDKYLIGIHQWETPGAWNGGFKGIIGASVLLVIVLAAGFVLRGRNATAVAAVAETPTERMPILVPETRTPSPTLTPSPAASQPAAKLVIDTDLRPMDNTDMWDWLNDVLPDLPAPSTTVTVTGLPDIAGADDATVMPARGLPGYLLVLRYDRTNVLIRLDENYVPVSRTAVTADHFSVTAGDYHWKVRWNGSAYDLPTEGSHGKFDIAIDEKDNLIVGWRFSLLP